MAESRKPARKPLLKGLWQVQMNSKKMQRKERIRASRGVKRG